MINDPLNSEKPRSSIATSELCKKAFYPIVVFALFSAYIWLFYPGIHDYDLIHLCYNATVGTITFWFPPLLGLAMKGLYQVTPPLTAIFILSSVGAWLAWTVFLVSTWSHRYILGTILIFLITLHPFNLISLIQPGRDAVISTTLLLAVSLLCLGVRVGSKGCSIISTILCFVALAIRPEMVVAVSPIIFIGLLQSMTTFVHKSISRVWLSTLLLPILILLFFLSHSLIKMSFSPGQPRVSGSLYYTQLRDLFLIARIQVTELRIEGFASSCALSPTEVQSLIDDAKGRLDHELKKIRPALCYSYRKDNAARIYRVWLATLLQNPVSYLRGRGGDLFRYLGNPKELKSFRLFTSFQYDKSVLTKCVGSNNLYPITGFYSSTVDALQASGDMLFTHGSAALSLHVLSIAMLTFRRRSLSIELKSIIWAVIISGLLHLCTFTFISPVTSFRYLRWFHTSSLVAPMLVASLLLNGRKKRE